MSKIIQEIENCSFTESRKQFLYKCFQYFESLNRPINILETGTQFSGKIGFTNVFAKFIKNYFGGTLTTIDNDYGHIKLSKKYNKEYLDVIDHVCADSVKSISGMPDSFINSIDLFFLDSYELNLHNPKPSSSHHLSELISFFYRVNNNSFIAIDDNYMPNTWVELFFLDGRKEIFQTNDKTVGKGVDCHDFLIEKSWTRHDDIVFTGNNNVFLYSF